MKQKRDKNQPTSRGKRFLRAITPARLLLAYCVVASTGMVVVFGLFLHTYQLQQRINGKDEFMNFVMESRLARLDEPVIAPKENRLYFHQARISVPVTDKTNDLLYRPLVSAVKDKGGVFMIYSKSAIHEIAFNSWSGDSTATCDNLATVTFKKEKQGENFPLESTIQLDDGRTLYVYPNQSDICANQVKKLTKSTPDTVVKLFKNAESY